MMPGFSRRQFPAVQGLLIQEPGDTVHQPGRHFQGFAGKGYGELVVRIGILEAPGFKIGPRLVRKHHSFGIKRIDQFRCQKRFTNIHLSGLAKYLHVMTVIFGLYDALQGACFKLTRSRLRG